MLKPAAETQPRIRRRTADNLAHAHAALAGSAANILAVEGGWYIAARLPRIRSEEDWALELLERENVQTQPGFFYDFESEAYLILSLLTETAVFQEGIAKLRAFVG